MSARVEAGTKALWVRNHDLPFEAMQEGHKRPYRREAEAVLAAADAVMFSDEAVERVDRAITAHEVITDGLEGPDGWCPTCGNTSDDDHQARAIIVALREAPSE